MFRLLGRCTLTALAFIATGSFALAPLTPAQAQAQSYPSKPVTIIVPLAAGTGMDSLVRLYGERLAQALGKPVVIENKPGAGLMLGTAADRRGSARRPYARHLDRDADGRQSGAVQEDELRSEQGFRRRSISM